MDSKEKSFSEIFDEVLKETGLDGLLKHNVVMPTIVVGNDYDGYFEGMVKSWIIAKLTQRKSFVHSVIGVTAGTYRMSAVSYESYETEDGAKRIDFDFYSPIRRGFGSLTDEEVTEIIELL